LHTMPLTFCYLSPLEVVDQVLLTGHVVEREEDEEEEEAY